MRLKKYLEEPYLLLILSSLLMLLMALLVHGTVDIINHDTYLVIHRSLLYAFVAIFSAFIWVIYICAKSGLPSKFLTRVHIYSNVVFLFAWIIFDFTGLPKNEPSTEPRTYSYYSSSEYIWDNIALLTVFAVFLLGIASFFLNLIIGIVRLIRNKFS